MRTQKLYLVPGIKAFWEELKADIWQILTQEPVVCCGDGRNDLPGHNAKYCVYILVEQFLDVIIDMNVVDSRELGEYRLTCKYLD